MMEGVAQVKFDVAGYLRIKKIMMMKIDSTLFSVMFTSKEVYF